MKKIICTLVITTFILNMGATVFAKEHTTVEEAKIIALNKVGLKADNVFFTKAKEDIEHGHKIWEIEFVSGDKEYEFDIDFHTLKVLDVDIDYRD
ncbi:MAG: PepSY domain-containing protein [Firmicutes bacterium]|nr:PepSY domain-containing protein [Bacillota bacterium]